MLLDFEAKLAQADYPPIIMDSFAGGGGASTGIEMALGRSPDIAINHNPVALALHEANHPETLHLSENVYRVDPLDYVAGKHVGLAWFSPDCKHFSKAKGGKPVERNIRDLAWIIPGWVDRIQKSGGCVDVVILENVEEVRDWGPLVDTDRGLMPDPQARGQTFQKWCKALRGLGGKIEWRELRACDYGAPTIRKRLFVIVRFDGQKIVWPKPTHAAPKQLLEDGYGHPDDPNYKPSPLKPWRTAAEIIDWSLTCPSIFDTTQEIFEKHKLRAVRPLAAATMSRVARGIDRYVLKAKRPFLIDVAHGEVSPSGIRRWGSGFRSVDDPLSVVTAGGINHAIVAPVFRATSSRAEDRRPRSCTDPANVDGASQSIVPDDQHPVCLDVCSEGDADEHRCDHNGNGQEESIHDTSLVGAPILIQTGYGEREGQSPRSLDIGVPLGTVVAGGVKHALAVPTLIGCGGRAGQSRPRGVDEPTATGTAKADVCLATAFLTQNNYEETGHDAREPLSTIVQKGSTQSVVAAHLLSMKGSDRRDSALDAPHPTVTTGAGKGGGGTAVVAPHLMTMRNAQKPFSSPDEPAHTITAGGAGLTVVAPFMQKYYGTGDGARVDDPCHSVTTKDRFGFVEGEIGWPPFTEAQAARARQVAVFMREQGFWDDREFVTVEIAGDSFTIVDIGMRMLTPRELFAAQGFPADYIIEVDYKGKSIAKSDQIACCGNSVAPPIAAALVAANCSHLARYREAAE